MLATVNIDFDIPSFTKQTEQIVNEASYSLVKDISILVKEEIQRHIPPPSSAWGGIDGGDYATGDLKDSIQWEVTKIGNTFRGTVGPVGGRDIQIKAYVHAYGRTIRSRKKKYMTFPTYNGWVSLERFTIRPKGFMLTGWSKARRELAKYR